MGLIITDLYFLLVIFHRIQGIMTYDFNTKAHSSKGKTPLNT